MSQHQRLIDEARALFEAGRFGESERLCARLINEKLAPAEATPLNLIMTSMAALNWTRNNRCEAFRLLYQALTLFPDYSVAKHMILALLREGIGGGQYEDGPTSSRLLFGLGSGRSGSTSLTKLLMLQPGVYASHEHLPLIHWQGDNDGLMHILTRMRILSRRYEVVSDVSHWWLPCIGTILTQHHDARFIVIKRDRGETVRSFITGKGDGRRGSINHWMDHDGSYWQKSLWDPTYPSFDATDMIDALCMYWDTYYRLAGEAAQKYPASVRIFDIAALSDPPGQRDILAFAGIADPVTVDGLRENVGTAAAGSKMIINPFA